eukprot:3843842-Pyramimonas_sp.AAC.1
MMISRKPGNLAPGAWGPETTRAPRVYKGPLPSQRPPEASPDPLRCVPDGFWTAPGRPKIAFRRPKRPPGPRAPKIVLFL